MIRRADDIKGLAAQLDAQPFSNIYALAALAGYPADDRFYRAYAAGPGALVLCGGTAYPFLPPGAPAEETARFLQMQNARCAVGDEQTVRALAAYMPGACIETSRMLVLHGPAPSGTLRARLCGRDAEAQVYGLLRACYGGLPDFQEYMDAKDQRRYYLGGRTAVCELDGRIVAAGAILCATDRAALVGALACAPQYRGRGGARAVVRALYDAAGGRALCLLAGQALLPYYARLGFQDLCAMAQLRIE